MRAKGIIWTGADEWSWKHLTYWQQVRVEEGGTKGAEAESK